MNLKEIKLRLTSYLELYYNHLGKSTEEISEKVDTYLEFVSSLEIAEIGDVHHVMPRCCGFHTNSFCEKGEIGEVNCGPDWWEWFDSEDNRIKLSISDHEKAHKLLSELFPEHKGFFGGRISFGMWNRSETSEEELFELFRENSKLMRTPEANEKRVKALKEKFGNSMSQLHTPKAIEKRKQTMIEKYGHANGNSISEEAKEKAKATKREKYKETNGVPPSYINTMNEKYGGLGKFMVGRIAITNGVEDRFINPDEEIPEGWHLGRKLRRIRITNGTEIRLIDRDSEIPEGWHKAKNKSGSTTGKVKCTNGVIEKYFYESEIPEGWRKGVITPATGKGRIWINNGVQSKMIFPDEEIPQGWSIGRGKIRW